MTFSGAEAKRIREDARRRMDALAAPPPPLRELVADHRTFIVVWDGSFK